MPLSLPALCDLAALVYSYHKLYESMCIKTNFEGHILPQYNSFKQVAYSSMISPLGNWPLGPATSACGHSIATMTVLPCCQWCTHVSTASISGTAALRHLPYSLFAILPQSTARASHIVFA